MEIADEKPKKVKLNLLSFSAWILTACFLLSIVTLIIYLNEKDYPDETLYLLLDIIRYSSFFLFICTFYKLLLNTYRIIKRSSRFDIKMVAYILLLIYSFIALLFEAVVAAVSSGI